MSTTGIVVGVIVGATILVISVAFIYYFARRGNQDPGRMNPDFDTSDMEPDGDPDDWFI